MTNGLYLTKVDGKDAVIERIEKREALEAYMSGKRIAVLGCLENPRTEGCYMMSIEPGRDEYYFSKYCRDTMYYMDKGLGKYLSFYKVNYVEG